MENSLCTVFPHLYHRSLSKNCTISDLLLRSENSVFFSFGFRRNLTNMEMTEVASFLSVLKGALLETGGEMLVFGILILVGVFVVNLCYVCCWILHPLRSRSVMWCGGLRFLRKLGSLSGKSCLAGSTLLIGLSGGRLCLLSLSVVCCVKWQREILITSFGIVSLRASCGAPFCTILLLALSA